MFKMLVPVIAFLSLFHFHPRTETMLDRVHASVIRMTTELPQGSEVCIGFVVATKRVLTANHCVGEHMTADGIAITNPQQDEFYDLALFTVDTDKPTLTIRDKPVVRFEQLVGVGYAFGWTRALDTQVTPLLIDYRPYANWAPGMFVRGGYVGGMSGGPVVDRDGQVVGIIQRSNDGVGFGVGALIIRSFLLAAIQ